VVLAARVGELIKESRDMADQEVHGFVVAGYEHGRLVSDWDGEVHPDRTSADKSLAECRQAGYRDWSLYALAPVSPEAEERKKAVEELIVARVREVTHTNRKTVRTDALRAILRTEIS
jgi:hypothetical protein